MIPRELRRDRYGLTRVARIAHADKLVAEARIIAATVAQDPARGIEQFASPRRPAGITAADSGRAHYACLISRATNGYARAGLGLLADEVRQLLDIGVAAWARFDRVRTSTEF